MAPASVLLAALAAILLIGSALADLPQALSPQRLSQYMDTGLSRRMRASQSEWSFLASMADKFHGLSEMPLLSSADQSSFLDSGARYGSRHRARDEDGEGSNCPGIEMCDPCYGMDKPFKRCKQWGQTCERLLCAPLCLRLLWEVKVTPGGGSEAFQKQIADIRISKALEGYFMTYACQDLLGCCAKGDRMNNWLERHVFQDHFPHPGMIEECKAAKDMASALALCKGNIKVKVTPIPGACEKFVQPEEPEDVDGAPEAFERSMLDASTETPKHRSFKERCERLQEVVEQEAAEWEQKFTEMSCACVGCDKSDNCPNSVTYDSIPRALKEEFGSKILDYPLDKPAPGGAASLIDTASTTTVTGAAVTEAKAENKIKA